MSVPAWGSASNPDPSVVTAALRRVVSVEGARAFADAGRLGALLRDELGADGRRHRPAVDAMTSLAADLGTALGATPPFQIGPLLEGWVSNQRQVDPTLARWAADAAGSSLNATPRPQPQQPEPLPQSQGHVWWKRPWVIPLAAFLTGALVLGGVWFAVEISTADPTAPPPTASTTTVTTARTVTETETPAVVALPVDIQSASIAGTWNVTLTQVDCQGLTDCPANGSTLTGQLQMSCSSGTCSGTYVSNPVSVGFDAARGGWVLNGVLSNDSSYTCNGVPIPSYQNWLLGVAQARYVDAGWEATSLTGQRTESAPAAGGCVATSLSYSVAAVPA